ncbi:MAG: hypothetical protein U0R49_03770 [Fimbriimonadales bacterium]
MGEEQSIGSAIARRWFWVSAAFFLLIQFGDWIKPHLFWAIVIAGAIGLLNVSLLFGLMVFAHQKLNLRPHLILSVIILLAANMLTLLVLTPFLPNDFKGIGDYFLGAITMTILVGMAQSIPDVFKPGGG